MTYKDRQLRYLAIVMAAVVALPGAAWAVSQAVHATATFLAALTLSSAVDLQFSKVDYTGAPSVAGDYVTVGTNGAALYGGVLSASAGAATAAGTVTVNTGSVGQTVLITCSTGGVMGDGATSTYNIISAEITTGAGVAFGSANLCNGVGVATTPATTKVLAGSDVFKVGAKFDGSSHAGSAFAGGVYTTVGHTDLNVQVVYQ